MRVQRVLVAANPRKPRALELEREVEDFLLEKGLKLARKADLLVTIGGDGTVLFNAHDHPSTPIFGVGSKRSFICQATNNNWRKKLEKVVEGGVKVEERMRLDAWLNGRRVEPCLNEFCVKASGHRLLKFELIVGKKKFEFRADGVIFSTPTGSTAYAYSAGGVELKPNEKRYEAVAIAPYRRKFAYVVVGERVESKLKIECEEDAKLIIDGLIEQVVPKKSVLRVRKSSKTTKFVKA